GSRGLLLGNARLEPATQLDPSIVPAFHIIAGVRSNGLLHGQRNPDIRNEGEQPGPDEASRRHTDHRECVAVDVDYLASDIRVALEMLAPEIVVQHADRLLPRSAILVGQESAAKNRMNTQARKIVAGDDFAPYQLGLLAIRHAERQTARTHQVREAGVRLTVI